MKKFERWMWPAAGLAAALLVLAGCPKGADGPKGDAPVVDGGTAEQGPPPAITCEQPAHDYGTVPQGTEVVHTFVIKNSGQGVLKIDRARGG